MDEPRGKNITGYSMERSVSSVSMKIVLTLIPPIRADRFLDYGATENIVRFGGRWVLKGPIFLQGP